MSGNMLKKDTVFPKIYLASNTLVTLEMKLNIKDSKEALVSYLSTGIQVLRAHRDIVGSKEEVRVESTNGIFQVSHLGVLF